jgi:hypothetical protein
MKKNILLVILTTLFAACSTLDTDRLSVAEKQALTTESKKIFMEFGQTLKGHLKEGLKSGGPVRAIDVCNQITPGVAADLAEKHGVELRRTSLKLRNPANAPDAWEKNVLIKFEKRKAAGEDVKNIAYTEVIIENGQRVFRMMKAIPTAQKPCLVCHGGKLKPSIAKKIDALYPEDMARDFKAGDIRGAFSLKKAL